jgi:GTP-binding protein Era
MHSRPTSRCGTIVLAGRPNAGKSTLLNALVGEELAIISPRPQSTRQPVIGIHTEGDTQFIFVDPPGLLKPGYPLQASMVQAAVEALRQADAIVYLHPATDMGPPPPLSTLVPSGVLRGTPIATARTFADQVPADRHLGGDEPVFRVGTPKGTGIEALLAWCRAQVPAGPFRYPPDDVSTQPVRFFVAEYVRQAAFAVLHDELPYAVAAQVDEFREGSTPLYIRVIVHVERESQKGIVIGDGGRTVKRIGRLAREAVERLLGQRVYLELWVKVLPNWRRSPAGLRRLGFTLPKPR